MNIRLKIITTLLLLTISMSVEAKSISKNEFLAIAFNEAQNEYGQEVKPNKKTLWLKDDLQSKIKAILDHAYPKLRLRYWTITSKNKFQTVWFLDEVGKELPISFAISIINNKVSIMQVLKFRESRGGEIQMQAFTEQFNQISIDNKNQLSKRIDGISGATMSVSAMKKISRVALMLNKEVQKK